jgi:hypothetical protein
MADGTKLKPMVIFKRKTMPKEKLPKGLLVCVQEKGWMNEDLVFTWLEKVWGCRPGGLLKTCSLLVWDMFQAHLMDSVKAKLNDNHNTYQAVNPGGTTSVLLPLDVSLNEPFKVHMRELWQDWMLNGKHERTRRYYKKATNI